MPVEIDNVKLGKPIYEKTLFQELLSNILGYKAVVEEVLCWSAISQDNPTIENKFWTEYLWTDFPRSFFD